MKVMLINPPWLLALEDRDFFRVTQPEGLGYIAAMLEEAGHTVKLIDASAIGWKTQKIVGDTIHIGMSYNQILNEIDSFEPQIVGISIISSLLKGNGFALAQHINEHNKKIKIVVGGAHPTVSSRECISKKYIDFVVVGEGELAMSGLVNSLQFPNPEFGKIKGLVYKKNGKFFDTGIANKVSDLDSLSFPIRDQYPLEDYFMASKKLLSSFSLSTYNKRWATMITSRGCPYNCIFCSIHLSLGRKWRARSAENVVSEIELLITKYRINYIAFLDDNMSFNKKRMHKILDLILDRNLRFEWSTPNGLRADTLDRELLLKMKRTGCTRIAVAAESGSQRVVNEVVKKNLDLKHITRVIKICKEIELKVDCFFVMGLIGETKEDLRKTIEFAKHLKEIGVSGLNLSIATPYIGTEFYNQLLEKGFITEDFGAMTQFRNNFFIGTDDFTSQELAEFKREASKIILFPFDYLKFIILILIRDPIRFIRLFRSQVAAILHLT